MKLSNITTDNENISIETTDSGILSLTSNYIELSLLPVYESNDEAKQNNLKPGYVYRTSNGDLKIVI